MKNILTLMFLSTIAFIPLNIFADTDTKTPAKLNLCIGCHAMDGNGLVPTYPKLAGQHAQYLEKQLKDFKGGFRKDSVMEIFAKQLSEKDITELSKYYSEQKLK